MVPASIVAFAFSWRDHSGVGEFREVGFRPIHRGFYPRRLVDGQQSGATRLKQCHQGKRRKGEGYNNFKKGKSANAATAD
jgi:hypothetical protein